MTKLHELAAIGQAVWYDYIRRALMTSGDLQRLLDLGVRGMTSNPTIFEKAIVGSDDYDDMLHELVHAGKTASEIYEALVLADIAQAADLLLPLYEASERLDGYISLEVSPTLAHDAAGTVAEARRLFALLNRPNVMIKVPATAECIAAIETLIADGINVNVTLMFSMSHYETVAEAYLSGLEKRAAAGGDLRHVASVASFFVSRVDTKLDAILAKLPGGEPLIGKIAIANAAMAYERFKQVFSGERWDALAAKGAQVQRVLWASTGTKNPNYPDTLYVDSLIAPHTVNTMPPATLEATLDHATIAPTLEAHISTARKEITMLQELGVDLYALTEELQVEGLAAFAQSFESLMASIEAKRHQIQLDEQQPFVLLLGEYQRTVDKALAELAEQRTISRIWAIDHTVWSDDPTEISNRLGWLHSPTAMREHLPAIDALVQSVRNDGYTYALLLGMGGSSLAPEVFRKTFGVQDGYLDLGVLDSTHPDAVQAYVDQLDLERTLFIVSTKSGGTVETFSFFKFFYNRVAEQVGAEQVGAHFVAITDPGSALEKMAQSLNFRAVFLNDPNIGGRYSALSYFGLVPAALLGVDLTRLLDRTEVMVANCANTNGDQNNYGAQLGVAMGELALAGRDKLTLILSPAIESLGDWIEQLVAESTGKLGKGVLPVVGEPIGAPSVYGDDRLFVYLHRRSVQPYTAAVRELHAAGQPVIHMHIDDVYDLGAQMFLWEMATVVAGARLAINPFDQPNVESAKVQARKMLVTYQEEGKLPELTPTVADDDILGYADVDADTAPELLLMFLEQVGIGDYVSIQAYVPMNATTTAALQELRLRIRDAYKTATTLGFGPRFLHSTGQLHKGDSGNGLFIQITNEPEHDLPIPDEAGGATSAMSFGTLVISQALGDRQALLDNGRRVVRFHVRGDLVAALARLQAPIRVSHRHE